MYHLTVSFITNILRAALQRLKCLCDMRHYKIAVGSAKIFGWGPLTRLPRQACFMCIASTGEEPE